MASAIIEKAAERLRAAGVSEDGIIILTATDAAANRVMGWNDRKLQAAAIQYPAAQTGYQQVASEFGLESGQLPGPTTFDPNTRIEGTGGAYKYANGVIVAPNPDGTMGVFIDAGDANQAGSHAWFEKVAKWDETKVEKWRKTLNQYGYNVAEKGGFDQAFRNALFLYHQNRYLNYGKPIAADQGALGGGSDPIAPDPAEIRNSVRAQYQQVFGDNPSDDELSRWEAFIRKTALGLQKRKGFDPGYAASAASERFVEKLDATPEAQLYAEQAEDDEMSTKMRDSIISIARLVG